MTLLLDCRAGGAVCDFGNTSSFRFGALPEGLSFTSQSGVLLSGLAQPGVPEPQSWALLISGFVLAGSAMRSRRRPFVPA